MNELEPRSGLMTNLLNAARFAAEKHSRQRRKDSAATPYINHPIAVAEVLARIGQVADVAILQAALLHDTLEDTETTAGELEEQFGGEVCRLVQEVTDDKNLPQHERKRLQIEHAPHLSRAAQQIKVADKICNVAELTPTEPAKWDLAQKQAYVRWAEEVVAGCKGCNDQLEKYFAGLVREKGRTLVQ
jgi:(p)ppGpp synthase/HD superfamily hydrolase